MIASKGPERPIDARNEHMVGCGIMDGSANRQGARSRVRARTRRNGFRFPARDGCSSRHLLERASKRLSLHRDPHDSVGGPRTDPSIPMPASTDGCR